ncbi:MAG: hypothetical protein PHJ00_07085 [Candidatus Omnitrophica bacterium]|jgi:hypothetical protein|nr:hypothetical protein [Candidatus Omnitrophota bacterium]
MSAPKSSKKSEKHKVASGNVHIADLVFISAIFLLTFFLNIAIANNMLLSPDPCGYLDMGRNLFTGKGAVTSYNIYQFWPDKYYPFLPYMPPLYPLVAGLLLFLFNLKAVIGFNVLLFSINCSLLYVILRLTSPSWICFLITLFMVFSTSIVNTAMYPWTEQLHLFFVLSVLLIYLKNKKASLGMGIILAVSCLVRAAGLYNFIGFMASLIIIRGFSKEALKEYARVAFGFAGVLFCYGLFCYIRYGVFYPQYLSAAKVYAAIKIFPGAFYNNTLPVLNMPPLNQGFDVVLLNTCKHFIDFIIPFKNLKFMLLIVPLGIIYDLIKRKKPLFIVFFCQGAAVILFYAVSFAWYPEPVEVIRYALIPLVMFVSIGFLYIKDILAKLIPNRMKALSPAAFAIIILSFLCANISEYVDFRKHCLDIYPVLWGGYNKNRDEMCEWIRANTDTNALIASDRVRDGFLLNRPFVSLPPGEAATRKNFTDHLGIYKPEYILLDGKNADIIVFLKRLGFQEKKVCGTLVLLDRLR